MTRVFLLVAARTLKNRVVSRIRRLREARYLAGALVGGGYLLFIFLRASDRSNHVGLNREGYAHDLFSLLVLALIVLAWVVPAMSTLEFSEAEMQTLFTAPLSRVRILQYKLIKSQGPMLISVTLLPLFGFPHGRYVGLWMANTVIVLYMTFVALMREWLREHGVPAIVPAVAALAAGGAATWWTVEHVQLGTGPKNLFASPALDPLLYVPRILVSTLFARTAGEVLVHALLMLAIGAALFFLSASLPVNFNELVMTVSQRAARFRRASRQQGAATAKFRIRPPFRLREGWRPEIAIIWKNSIATVRVSGVSILAMLALWSLFLWGALHAADQKWQMPSTIVTVAFACVFPLLGAAVIKQDLRMDMARLDVLKSMPLSGASMIAAQMGTPLAIVAVVEFVLLAGVSAVLAKQNIELLPQLMVMAFAFAIPICAVQLVIRNAVPLFFPAWSVRPHEEQRGFAVFGQRLLGLALNLLAFAITLVPAAIAGGVGYLLADHFIGDTQAALAATIVPAVAVVLAEVWAGVHALGVRYDQMDVAQELELGL